MRLRKLKKREHILTRPLYEEVFPEDSREFVDYYYKEKTRDNKIYVVEEDGDIQAMLHLNPYHMYVGGTKKKAHYIVAVATRASYRSRGYMRALLLKAMKEMYQSREPFTFLMPAAEAIYLPYDFRTVHEQKRRFHEDGKVRKGVKVSILDEKECQELADWANQELSENYQVFAIRDAGYYQRLKMEYEADGGRLMVYRRAGRLVDCRPYVPEEEEEQGKIMVRIVDVVRMLQGLEIEGLAIVCFEVTDPLIPENNRSFVLAGSEHSGVMLTDGREADSEGKIPVSVLTQFVFGALSPEEMYKMDDVEMTERMKGEFEKIIPLSKLYINEIV